MTAIALQFPSGRDYPRRSFSRLFLNLINGFREAREISNRYQQLSHMSDEELTARNIRREDLPRIAFTGRA
jgi:hypothetical protein